MHPLGESVYAFDGTFIKLIFLTAKALRRITMRGFLVGATESNKPKLKRVKLSILGLCVIAKDYISLQDNR